MIDNFIVYHYVKSFIITYVRFVNERCYNIRTVNCLGISDIFNVLPNIGYNIIKQESFLVQIR